MTEPEYNKAASNRFYSGGCFEWHSMNCTCPPCLVADYARSVYDSRFHDHMFNLKGLAR